MSARSSAQFYPEAGRIGHLYDHLTCYVTFPPRSYDEMEFLDAGAEEAAPNLTAEKFREVIQKTKETLK